MLLFYPVMDKYYLTFIINVIYLIKHDIIANSKIKFL